MFQYYTTCSRPNAGTAIRMCVCGSLPFVLLFLIVSVLACRAQPAFRDWLGPQIPGFDTAKPTVILTMTSKECSGCAIPAFNAIIEQADRMKDRVNLAILARDLTAEDEELVRARLQTKAIVIDRGGQGSTFLHAHGVPEMFVLERDGTIRTRIADVMRESFILADVLNGSQAATRDLGGEAIEVPLDSGYVTRTSSISAVVYDVERDRLMLMNMRANTLRVFDRGSGRMLFAIKPSDTVRYFFRSDPRDASWKTIVRLGTEMCQMDAVIPGSDGRIYVVASVMSGYTRGVPRLSGNGVDSIYPVKWRRRQLLLEYREQVLVGVRPIVDSSRTMACVSALADSELVSTFLPDYDPDHISDPAYVDPFPLLWRISTAGATRGEWPAIGVLRSRGDIGRVDPRFVGLCCRVDTARMFYANFYNNLFYMLDASRSSLIRFQCGGRLHAMMPDALKAREADEPLDLLPWSMNSVASNGSTVVMMLNPRHGDAEHVPVLQVYTDGGIFVRDIELRADGDICTQAFVAGFKGNAAVVLSCWERRGWIASSLNSLR